MGIDEDPEERSDAPAVRLGVVGCVDGEVFRESKGLGKLGADSDQGGFYPMDGDPSFGSPGSEFDPDRKVGNVQFVRQGAAHHHIDALRKRVVGYHLDFTAYKPHRDPLRHELTTSSYVGMYIRVKKRGLVSARAGPEAEGFFSAVWYMA